MIENQFPYETVDFNQNIVENVITELEAKDMDTANHSRRVSEMAKELCKKLNIKKSECEKIYMAASFHDIGKIVIPNSVLTKTVKLTKDEWILMKEHSKLGAEILNQFGIMPEIISIVLHHHERWDGKGYNSGLSMENIPLGSRIIAVCDSVDAMLSVRVYRLPLSMKQCMLEIEQNMGIMYDPIIAACLLANWDNIVKNAGIF